MSRAAILEKLDEVGLSKVAIDAVTIDKHDIINYLVAKHEQVLIEERERLAAQAKEAHTTRDAREKAFVEALARAGAKQYGKAAARAAAALTPLYGKVTPVFKAKLPDNYYSSRMEQHTRGIDRIQSVEDMRVKVSFTFKHARRSGSEEETSFGTPSLTIKPDKALIRMLDELKENRESGIADRQKVVQKALRDVPAVKRALQAQLTAKLLKTVPHGNELIVFLDQQLQQTLKLLNTKQ
jgi:hypothetical protein